MNMTIQPLPQRSASRQAIALVGWLLLTFAFAGVGALASLRAETFYTQLIRPTWAPPSWLFGPVWSVLYLLMGIAAWLVWRSRGFRIHRGALVLYIVQLVANALWTWLFFAWHRGAMASIEVVLLWLLILATLVSFWRRNALAGVLLLPYLAWVTFASALTLAVWRLNPGLL